MTEEAVDLAGAAALVYLSPSRFRQVWRTWRVELGFPAPFRFPEAGSNYAWDAQAIRDWKADRARGNLPRPRLPANDARARPSSPADPSPARLSRERARLQELLQGDR